MNAAELLAAARVVLLDFDGPVTSLMPPPTNVEAADAARAVLLDSGVILDEQIEATTDHLAVLRWTGAHAPKTLFAVEQACDEVEVRAALACTPTAGAHDFLAVCQRAGRPVVIVSNNATSAIDAYLNRWRLGSLVRAVIGRPTGQPDLMKPHPHTVNAAIRLTGTEPDAAVLVGDSVSDIQVARVVGVRSIGYAKTAARGVELAAAGADALTEHVSDLVEAH